MINRTLLDKDQLYEMVRESLYVVRPEEKYRSRCFTGRYKNTNDLPALSLPGGDAGELALLYSTANSCGFEVFSDKAFRILCTLIGGIQHLSFHSDKKEGHSSIASGCFYISSIYNDPVSYHLSSDHIATLQKQLEEAKKKGAEEKILPYERKENAVILLSGEFGLNPEYELQMEGHSELVQAYIYQSTLVNERRKIFAKKLVEEGAVKLFEGCDEEYLYEVISEMAENHLYLTLDKQAKGLPLFKVHVETPSKIKIDQLDSV